MKKVVRINEHELKHVISESVKHILNELSYDDWKLMTPEEDAHLSSYDVAITINVAVSDDELNLWDDCEKTDIEQIDDGLTAFTTTFKSNVWISDWCNDRDSFDDELREQCEECASEFVHNHRSEADYELVNYKTI